MSARIRGLALLAAAVALLGLPASAGARDGRPLRGAGGVNWKGIALSTIKLKGSHGYEVEVTGVHGKGLPKKVAIVASRKPFSVDYNMPGETGSGLSADFGALGGVDVDFHRRKRSVERFGKRCRFVTESGVFRGDIHFSGEGRYTSADAAAAKGEILRLPNGLCGLFGDRKRGDRLRLETTTLAARSRTANGSITVEASDFLVRSGFSLTTTVREKAGALEVTRSATMGPRRSLLTIGPGKHPHSADLHAGSPLTGSAHFQDPVDGPPTWTGSLAIAFPGLAPVPLAGPAFAARVCVDQYLTKSCNVSLPPGKGRPGPKL